MATALLQHPDMDRRDLTSLVQISIGGSPTPPTLLAEVEQRFGCTAICGYGMTESSPTITRSLDKPGEPPSAARRATTGLPILGVDARVLGAGDVEVPWDGRTTGEICVRSNHVMAGYWQAPEATAAALRGGWLRTGDVATVSADGYLTIVDRTKDLIVSGGENISGGGDREGAGRAPGGRSSRGRRRGRRALGRGARARTWSCGPVAAPAPTSCASTCARGWPASRRHAT